MSSKTTKKIPSALPFFDDDDILQILSEVKQILTSKRLVLGPYTKKFEDLFSKYIGTKYGIAVNSATAALDVVLRYCNVKGGEVIVPTNTFVACPNTVIYSGGKPVFADMDQRSFCMDISDVKRKITEKTKAIMVVHLSGMPQPQMDELQELTNKKGIHLFEDCSHAHGSSINNKKVGSLSLAGCFSFFATKIMPTGTGGMITTDDRQLREFAEALRHQGGIGGEGQIEVFDKFGYDWMMNEMTASVGINQISKLEKQIEKRIMIAKQYEKELRSLDWIETLPAFENTRNVCWKFITILDGKIDRNKVREVLRKEYTIDAGILYPTLCHLQPIYRQLGHKEGECPVAERIMKRQLTLPVNPYMTNDDVNYVVESLKEVVQRQI